MAAIEERIVRMKLDSSQFARNAGLVVQALTLINEALKFTNAGKGFSQIEQGAKNVKFDGMQSSLESLNSKFSALGVIGMSALNRITNAAISAGQAIMNEFVSPISQGFSEYEMQLNSVQTILANTQSKGTSLDQVNAALAELNTYADKTIYNFAQMTHNIGTFTAAGVDLDTSVASIKGLANLAAVSGSSATQASSAMYQLSQAIAAGRVSLMDWNSVVYAGMGGELFQNALKRTAENFGTNVDAIIEKYGSFRESLTKGEWLTTDVLTETLKQISGAYTEADLMAQGYSESQAKEIVQLAKTAEDSATEIKTFTQIIDTSREALGSGWAQTWQIVFGDFEEAKTLWTNVADVVTGAINNMSDTRNSMLQEWSDMGGRTKIIEALGDAFEGLRKIVDTVGKAFKDVFPDITAKNLMSITDAFADFAKNLKGFNDEGNRIQRSFKGLFSAIDLGLKIVQALGKGLFDILDSLFGLGDGFLDVTSKVGDFISKINEAADVSNVFQKIIDGVTSVLDIFVGAANIMIDGVITLFDAAGKGLSNSGIAESVNDIADSFSKAGEINGNVGILTAAFQKIVDFFAPAIESISEFIGTAIDQIGQFFGAFLENGDFNSLLELINTGLVTNMLLGVRDFIKDLGANVDAVKQITDKVDSITKNFKKVLDSVSETLNHFQKTLDATALLALAGAIGVIADAIDKISKIDNDKVYDALSAIAAMFVELLITMSAFDKFSITGFKGVWRASASLLSIAGAVDLLTIAVERLSKIPMDKLATSIGAIAFMIAELYGAMALFGGLSSAPTARMSASLIAFALALDLLVPAVAILSGLDTFGLVQAVVAIDAIGAAMAGFSMMISGVDIKMENAIAFAAMAVAIDAIMPAIAILSAIDTGRLASGVFGLGAILAELSFAMSAIDKMDPITVAAGSFAMIELAVAMGVMSLAMEKMSSLGMEGIATALVGLAGGLTEMLLVLALFPPDTEIVNTGASLLIVALAMEVMGDAMRRMGSISWEELSRGLAGFSGVLVEVAFSMMVMKESLVGAQALIVASAAFLVFAAAMKLMSGIGWVGIAASLIAVAGGITVMGVAAKILSGMLPVFTGFAAAMAIFAAGMALMGVGLLAAGAGLASFAASGVAAAKGITAVLKAVASTIPTFITGVVDGIVAAMDVLKRGAPAIAEGITAVLSSMLDSLDTLIPKLVDVLVNVFQKSIESLASHVKGIGNALFDLLLGIFDVVTERAPELVAKLAKMIKSIFEAVFENLKDLDTISSDELMKTIIGFGTIFVALGAMYGGIKKGFKSAAVLAAGMVLLGGVTDLILNFTPDDAIEKATGLSEAMLAIAAVFKIMSTIPIPAALTGSGSLGIAIGAATGIVSAMGGLAQIPGFNWLVGEGATALENVGNAIGKFFGGIIGGGLEGISDSFPAIATNLSNFMTNLKPMFESASEIPENATAAIEGAAKAVLALTASDLLDSIKSWLTGEPVDFKKFGEQLASFGPALKDFAESVKGLDLSGVAPAMEALDLITASAKEIPNEGGAAAWWAGDNPLGNYKDDLKKGGEGIKSFSDAVVGIDTSGVKPAMEALKTIVEVSKDIPNEGGAAAFWAGDNSLAQFASSIESIGTTLVNFAIEMEGISKYEDSIETGLDTLETLVGSISTIQGFDGGAWATSFEGIKSFITSMNDIAGGIVSFGESIGDLTIDTEQVDSIGQAISKMSYWMSQITTVDAGKITSFKEAMTNAGDLGLKTLNESIGNLATTTSTKFQDLSTSLSNYVPIVTQKIEDLRLAITSKSGGLGGTLSVNLQGMVDTINSQAEKFGTAFTGVVNKVKTFQSDMQNAFNSGKDTVRSGLNQMIFSIQSYNSQFESAGNTLMKNLKSGIRDGGDGIGTALSSSISSAVSSIRGYYGSFYTAGSYLAQGFANGISSSAYAASVRASAMADAAVQAAQAVLDENSPSKVFYKIGAYATEGFINGLASLTGSVERTSSSMANSATAGLKSSLSNIQTSITPVVDLSMRRSLNLSNGVLDGMSLGIKNLSLRNVRGEEIQMMDDYYRRIQNSNENVASAIGQLRGDMSKYASAVESQETAVYVDGKKLASTIAKPMNQQLGIRSRRGSLSRV